ncbi:deoxyribose-phosphate aldolase [Anaerotruncus colihominis]|uniref:Deoxyribose-phosphate aldolase n=1 Tax=Anaerotruncus colihominis TaxID=169435 RepID=A0A1Y4EFU9_9FIRM|nr:deoxyribose-phosphate aldolase [Anaerotruncus colihominis]OUO66481.1 deoxyribose-phosphate aldolase [Anaerotruncus colihominis]OUP67837.1 deoxyribose-phosphate aldolase [Anaerotruncus colihominis]OUP73028.1 deoxyribose-phosphate aldolase [Anaerotruncus colihominis]
MDKEKVLGMIDHTLLKAVSTWPEIESLCDEAVKYHTASVCVPPCFIKRIHDQYGDALAICTVIGFPLGYNTTEIKVAETRQAIADGAVEVDMVVNLGDVKSGAFDKVTEEIRAVKQAAGSRILKVIIETCYLTEAEKIALCRCVTDAGADYIKTSTGFGTAGAQLEDIALFRKHIGPKVKIKAAGGIRTPEDLEAFVNAGCDRIGTSSAVKLLR